MKNKYIGSSFDDFLKEEGFYEECTAAAIKRVIAFYRQNKINIDLKIFG